MNNKKSDLTEHLESQELHKLWEETKSLFPEQEAIDADSCILITGWPGFPVEKVALVCKEREYESVITKEIREEVENWKKNNYSDTDLREIIDEPPNQFRLESYRNEPNKGVCINLSPIGYFYYLAVHDRLHDLKNIRELTFKNALHGLSEGKDPLLPFNFAVHLAILDNAGQLLVRRRIREKELFGLAWEASCGELMNGPHEKKYCHVDEHGNPDLWLLLKKTVKEELAYDGAKPSDFKLYGIAMEYESLAPKLMGVYKSDLSMSDLVKGSELADDGAERAEGVDLTPSGIAQLLLNKDKYDKWSGPSKLGMVIALCQTAASLNERECLIAELVGYLKDEKPSGVKDDKKIISIDNLDNEVIDSELYPSEDEIAKLRITRQNVITKGYAIIPWMTLLEMKEKYGCEPIDPTTNKPCFMYCKKWNTFTTDPMIITEILDARRFSAESFLLIAPIRTGQKSFMDLAAGSSDDPDRQKVEVEMSLTGEMSQEEMSAKFDERISELSTDENVTILFSIDSIEHAINKDIFADKVSKKIEETNNLRIVARSVDDLQSKVDQMPDTTAFKTLFNSHLSLKYQTRTIQDRLDPDEGKSYSVILLLLADRLAAHLVKNKNNAREEKAVENLAKISRTALNKFANHSWPADYNDIKKVVIKALQLAEDAKSDEDDIWVSAFDALEKKNEIMNMAEDNRYIVWTSNPHEGGRKGSLVSESYVQNLWDHQINDFDIFIRREDVFVKGVDTPFEPRVRKLLVLLLRYRPDSLPPAQACIKAWPSGTVVLDDVQANKLLVDAIKPLNSALSGLSGFVKIQKKVKGGGYRYKGKQTFCIIEIAKNEKHYHLTV